MPMVVQNLGSGSPQNSIPRISKIIVSLISQVTMQPLFHSLPQASGVQSIPTILSAAKIPVVQPSVPYMQVSFQGLPQSQFVQGTPFQTQFLHGQPLQSQPFQGQLFQGQMGQSLPFQNQSYPGVSTAYSTVIHYGSSWIPRRYADSNYSGYPRISWISSSQYGTRPSGLSISIVGP